MLHIMTSICYPDVVGADYEICALVQDLVEDLVARTIALV